MILKLLTIFAFATMGAVVFYAAPRCTPADIAGPTIGGVVRIAGCPNGGYSVHKQ